MKVCMITGTLPSVKCGVGDYTNILCTKLNESKYIELSVITTKGLRRDKKYTTYDIMDKWDFSETGKIINKLDEIKPDIVHIQYPTLMYKKNAMINFLPLLIKRKYKIVHTIHEYSDNSTLGKIRIWPNIISSDVIVVVDKQYIEDIKKFRLFKNKNISYINIASNIPKSTISNEKIAKIRSKILDNNCSKIAGYFGFINKTKGIENILYSLKRLKDGHKLKTKFLILGEFDKSNDYHKSILKLIDELEIKKYIHITGYLDKNEVGNYIKATDYMILPFVNGLSTKNGSFLAALQEGKYIITTKRNGQKVFNSENIYYLDEKSREDDIDVVINNMQESSQDGSGKLENTSFNWDDVVKNHISIYEKLC